MEQNKPSDGSPTVTSTASSITIDFVSEMGVSNIDYNNDIMF
jgi:hypothetical protein